MGYRDFIARLFPITGEQLDSKTVTYDKIADNTITANQVAAGAIVAAGITNGTITNNKLASTAVTEAVTVAKTFTNASLSDTAGIRGTQLASAAAIAGTQLGFGTLHQVKTAIAHSNATPTIAALPAGALLLDVWTVCTETYDATAPTIDIGYVSYASVILPTASIGKTATNVSGDNPSVRGTDLWVPGAQDGTPGFAVQTYGHPRVKFYATATTVIATIAGASGNTTGTMDVYLSYLQTVV